jgi:hypothetical protein
MLLLSFCNISATLWVVQLPSDLMADPIRYLACGNSWKVAGCPREIADMAEITYEVCCPYYSQSNGPLDLGSHIVLNGVLHTDYDVHGMPTFHLHVDTTQLQEGPGEPETDEYMEGSIGIINARVTTVGMVVATPIDQGNSRMFTLDVTTHRGCSKGQNLLRSFRIHVVLPDTEDWRSTPLPPIGHLMFVTGEVIGQYTYERQRSLCVVTKQLVSLPTTPIPLPGATNPLRAA